jgi:alpha-amylase
MLDIVLCFHIHQPYRLRTVRLVDRSGDLFDDVLNRAVVEKAARTCYIPACDLLKGLMDRYGSEFKCAFSITGTAAEQFSIWKPVVMERLCGLAATRCVEFIGETYYHSLFSHFDRGEFIEQVRQHSAMMEHEFLVLPRVFRNTELLYDDRVSDYLSTFDQFHVLLCEDAVADQPVTQKLYRSYNDLHVLLLRNHRLTDDIAFRFSNREWAGYPLTAEKFASWLEEYEGMEDDGHNSFLLLYMDYETLGEHHAKSTGIFQFFQDLAEIILNSTRMRFSWPSDVLRQPKEHSTRVSVQKPVSWADSGKDLSAWLSSDLQKNAMHTLLEVSARVRRNGEEALLERVRRLSSSDHFYYMYPWEGGADAEVHRHFSPYHSPEDAYMRYINALTALELNLS